MLVSQHTDEESLMLRALALARKGLGFTSPNPAVGCVIAREGRIISTGYHRGAGLLHAEREAIQNCPEPLLNSTLVVTLEPCNHTGRTPPCTELIVESGIRRVVFGAPDPNPEVKGGGARYLEERGIQVRQGVLRAQCEALIAPFSTAVLHKRPHLTLKLAVTKDGFLETGDPKKRWISSEASRAYVQRLRSRADGIMVGKGTIQIDNPLLTNRLKYGANPLRIILDSELSLSPNHRVFTDSAAETLVYFNEDGPGIERRKEFLRGRTSIQGLKASERIEFLRAMFQDLHARGKYNILCEGGESLSASLIEAGLVDQIVLFTASEAAAAGAKGKFTIPDNFKITYSSQIGSDILEIFKRWPEL